MREITGAGQRQARWQQAGERHEMKPYPFYQAGLAENTRAALRSVVLGKSF